MGSDFESYDGPAKGTRGGEVHGGQTKSAQFLVADDVARLVPIYRRYAIVSEADLSEGVGKLAELTGTKKGQSEESARVVEMR